MEEVKNLMVTIFSSSELGRKLLYVKFKYVVNVKSLQMETTAL